MESASLNPILIPQSSASRMLPTPKLQRKPPIQGFLQPDPFLNELKSMFERSTEKGSVWVTFKRSSMKSKAQKNKMSTAGDPIEYRCLVRATDGKQKISTTLGAKDHQRFQASYATILKAHMTSLKKRERNRKKVADGDKKDGGPAKKPKGA